MPYSMTNIRKLDLFKPDIISDSQYRRELHDDLPEQYFHFPALLNPDRSLWQHGSLYLLKKLECYKTPSSATLTSQASDLVAFMNYMEEQGLDYLSMPKRKAVRPTYHFRFHLQDLIQNGKISASTASRRMNAVINFYRWLSKQHNINFQHEPWSESTAVINYDTYIGHQQSKLIQTTNLAVRVPPSNETFSDYLLDGGKLKPLSMAQQSSILKALGELENTEMTLMFLLALSTGARLQTICTLRLSELQKDHSDSNGEVRIVVGPGTSTDSKLSKRAILYVPTWMFKKLRTYSLSARAIKRRQRNNTYSTSQEHYIFLTKGGQPYYMGKNDPSIGKVKRPPVGNAITQFIHNMLLPKLKEMGCQFKFRFHDLRASYGMNLVEINQENLNNGVISYQKLRDFIRERMWHKSSDTTDLYLQYKSTHKFLLGVQENYEQHLQELMNGALIHE
jgi:integrase